MKVVKELTFDAAHMLSNYEGKCNNLHGHTYKVCVELSGECENRMLVDFNRIKAYFDKFDHAIIFAGKNDREDAEAALLNWCEDWSKKYFVMPEGRPTAENMAEMFAKDFLAIENVKEVKVWVWETPSAYAEVQYVKK